jgi:hypothetical protein
VLQPVRQQTEIEMNASAARLRERIVGIDIHLNEVIVGIDHIAALFADR